MFVSTSLSVIPPALAARAAVPLAKSAGSKMLSYSEPCRQLWLSFRNASSSGTSAADGVGRTQRQVRGQQCTRFRQRMPRLTRSLRLPLKHAGLTPVTRCVARALLGTRTRISLWRSRRCEGETETALSHLDRVSKPSQRALQPLAATRQSTSAAVSFHGRVCARLTSP